MSTDEDPSTESDVLHVPLFKLKMGVSASSDGLPCAKHAGIAPDILARAAAIKSSISTRSAIPANRDRGRNMISGVQNKCMLKVFLKGLNWLQQRSESDTSGSSLSDMKSYM
jgi:DNA mismatch repair ATPase MutS